MRQGVRTCWETTALNTYLALDAVRHALLHAVDRYSREYLIESIEHEIENQLNPGTFPRLSLGPGQRFAAKGASILSSAKAYDHMSGQVSLAAGKEPRCGGKRAVALMLRITDPLRSDTAASALA